LELRQALASSRWVGLGTFLGFAKGLRRNDGKGAREKLQKLRDACAASPWLKAGRFFGEDVLKTPASKDGGKS
jgi:hypothetical protein